MSPLEAIKEKCLDCCCGQTAEIKLCTATNCPLYSFRKAPKKTRIMTDEQKAKVAERFKKAREAKKKN